MKPLKDYSFIRGVCHGLRGEENWDRDFGYAKRLKLNSSRIWLSYKEYESEGDAFVEKLRRYIRKAWSYGISTMPILWNGNGMDPGILEPSYWETGDKYVKAIVEGVKGEEGLIMWDIMNEPSCNDYLRKAGDARPGRWEKMNRFLEHYCKYVKELDPENAITIGHTFPEDLEPSSAWVDVISFHDYLETRARIEKSYVDAEAVSKKYGGKPLVNSELACLCRANPYDLALLKCEEHKVGWYLFNLICDGYWGDVHGIVYPDGTVRDPSIIAAIMGFHRNRGKTRIAANPNKEGNVYTALELIEDALKDEVVLFKNKRADTDGMLEAAEYAANLLEGCEMVPMNNPPTARILDWRALPEEQRPLGEIRAFTYELGQELKKWCQIL